MEKLKPGNILQSKYEIISILGSGGMGTVYLVHGMNLEKKWAIKELINICASPEEKEQAIIQFKIEARILANMHHLNLPRVVDYFEESGRHYLVMDYIEGKTLKEIIEDKQTHITIELITDWSLKIAEILDYLHSQTPPIIFRDLKHTNIMIEKNGKLKLIDFGISKIFYPHEATLAGSKGFGTPGFSAPEQYGQGISDARSDVYSLGALTYYMISKEAPPDVYEMIMNKTKPKSLREYDKHIPETLERIVFTAMDPNKENRFQSMKSMHEALNKFALSYKTVKMETPSNLSNLSFERMRQSFRKVFITGKKWKEESDMEFDFSLSHGILQKDWIVVKIFRHIDEETFLNYLDSCIIHQKNISQKSLNPIYNFYFIPIFQSTSNLNSISDIAEKNTISKRSQKRRFIIPVLFPGEIIDKHIPESLKNSNDLNNIFLNISIAINNI